MTHDEWLTSANPREMLAWLTDRPQQAAATNRRRVSDRKLRLFAAACCRAEFGQRLSGGARAAVEAAERFADGDADGDALFAALRGVKERPGWRASRASVKGGGSDAAEMAAWGALEGCREETEDSWGDCEARLAAILRDTVGDPFAQVALWRMRCSQPGCRNGAEGAFRAYRHDAALGAPICDDCAWPIRRLPSHTWLTPQVLSLASAAYERARCEHCTGPAGDRRFYTGLAQHKPCPECGRAHDWVEDGTLDDARLAVLSDALEEAGCGDERLLAHLRSPGPHYRGMWSLDVILGRA